MFKYEVGWKGSIPADVACTLHTDAHIYQQKRQHAGSIFWEGYVGCTPGKERKDNS